jgi:molybdopterin-binding protein
MNRLVATVSSIDSMQSLNIVEFTLGNQRLTMMSLELGDDIALDTSVRLTVKPSHVTLAKNLSGMLSHSNRLNATIKSIQKGKLLSIVELMVEGFSVESMITTKALDTMQLQKGEALEMLIKASDLSIVEVLHA